MNSDPVIATGIHLIYRRLQLWAKVRIGQLFNLAGLPGFVRDCSYTADIADVTISVHRGALFTIITVNGVDIYFYRITGEIDGIGGSPIALGRTDLMADPIGPIGPLGRSRKEK